MTKNYKINKRAQTIQKIINGVLITGAVIAATIYGPKVARAIDIAWMNDDYNDDHKEMSHLRERLNARMQNDNRTTIDTDDSYEVDMKSRLEFLEKRHIREKKTTPCWQCEDAQKVR